MKTKYKYLILIFLTIFASVCIYRYVEASTPVDTKDDILAYQNNKENEIINSGTYTINNPKVVLNPYDISPLTAVVVFSTNDLASATVTVHGKDGDQDIVNTFLPSKLHVLPIYGLYPNFENTVTITSSGETQTIKIQTNDLPSNIKNIEPINGAEGNDFYFTTSLNNVPIGYDSNGQVRWYLTSNYGFEFIRLSNGHILLGNDSLIKSPYYRNGLVEMDMLGKIYFEYNIPGGYHHDVFELANGNLLTLSNNPNKNTVEDYIVEIDRNNGQIVKEINLSKLISHDKKADWLGLNSIVYDAKSNSIIVCGQKQNMLINIDYSSGEINWIIGDAPKKLEKYLLTSTNEITKPNKPQGLVITNDGKLAYVSDDKIIIYQIDAVNKTVTQTNEIALEDKTDNVNLDYTNDHFIISQGTKIKKASDDSTTLFETDYDIYSVKNMKLYAGDVYMVGSGQRLGSMGISKTIDNSILLWKLDRDIFKKYDLNLYKDANRLVVSGTFNKNDKVEIILDNILNKHTYKVDIDKTLAEKGKVKASAYINEEGLDGKYYIYLKINNDTYKLEKYAIFH